VPGDRVQLPGHPLLLTASQHLGRAPGGGSGAQLYQTTKELQTHVVKLQGTQQGIRVLFNEYVAGRIGEMIGVPFGQHALVQVPEPLLPAPGEPNLVARWPGTQYGTVYFGNAQSDLNQLRQSTNCREFASVLVFDTFIARGNGRRFLVYPSSGQANSPRDLSVIMDQGFAFSG
jgi:hypothetical protein